MNSLEALRITPLEDARRGPRSGRSRTLACDHERDASARGALGRLGRCHALSCLTSCSGAARSKPRTIACGFLGVSRGIERLASTPFRRGVGGESGLIEFAGEMHRHGVAD
jgi:hypothetical protein